MLEHLNITQVIPLWMHRLHHRLFGPDPELMVGVQSDGLEGGLDALFTEVVLSGVPEAVSETGVPSVVHVSGSDVPPDVQVGEPYVAVDAHAAVPSSLDVDVVSSAGADGSGVPSPSPRFVCWTCGRQLGQSLYSKIHQWDHRGLTDGEFGRGSSHATFALLVNGYLQKLDVKLGYDDLMGLLDRAQSDETIWPPSAEGVQAGDKEAMSIFCWVNNLSECDFQIRPPNSAACLLHWRVQVGLLALLTEEQQEEVKVLQSQEQLSFVVNLAVKREGLKGCNILVDSHCHLKRWLQDAQCEDLGQLLRKTDFRGCNSPNTVRGGT